MAVRMIDYRFKPKVILPPYRCWRDVERHALRSGLTAGTMDMLAERGFGSIKSIREVTEDDLEVLPLYVGQQLAVSKLVKHLNTVLEGFDEEDDDENNDVDTQGSETQVRMTEEELEELERQRILKAFDDSILADDLEEADTELGLPKLPRPHQFILGKMRSRDLTMEEFVYGNLLILEYLMEQKPSEVRASLKHIRFMVLKLLYGYQLKGIINYDAAVRRKMERYQSHMPKEADQDLISRHVILISSSGKKRSKKKGKMQGKAKRDR